MDSSSTGELPQVVDMAPEVLDLGSAIDTIRCSSVSDRMASMRKLDDLDLVLDPVPFGRELVVLGPGGCDGLLAGRERPGRRP